MVFAWAGDSTMTRGLGIADARVNGTEHECQSRGRLVTIPATMLDPTHLLNTFGAFGLFVILFAETGILVGIVLPGDSLLFTAGLLSATHKHGDVHLNVVLVLVMAFLGAVLGAQTGYVI